jgi:hypothetical protein
LTQLAGGVNRPDNFFSPGICRAIKQGAIAHGFRWFTARKWLMLSRQAHKLNKCSLQS